MTRIAGVADLHVGATHLTTLDDQRRALERVCEVVEDRAIQVVALAGDTTHQARPSPEVFALIGSFIGRLDRAGADIVIVAGNHDPLVPAVAQHFRGRVHVALQPRVVHLDGIDLACLPYLPDRHVRADAGGTLAKEELAAQLTFAARSIVAGFRAQRRPGVPMVLVGHFTVAGSETPTGFQVGWIPGTTWVVPIEDLADFDLVVAGHIHKRQRPAANVAIPGSLLPLDFSELEEKGVVLADITDHTRSWEFVTIPTPRPWTYEETDPRQLLRNVKQNGINELVRVRLRVDEETAREYPPSRIERALLEAGARRAQIELKVEHPDRARDAEMTSELLPLTALARYLEGREDLEVAARTRVVAAGTTVTTELLEQTRGAGGAGDLELTRIEAHDFLGLASASITLEGLGVGTLCGPVGAGKSTLGCDVPRFALWGETRLGGQVNARLVRVGATEAMAAVELRDTMGRRLRIVRKVKVAARGRASSQLDVLVDRDGGDRFDPLAESAKIGAGEAAVGQLLGGLSDATATAANFVVQREADRFTRARPEERKALLAEAAGLAVYDDLARVTVKHLNDMERDLARLEAQAKSLRPRAEALERIQAEHEAAVISRDAAAGNVRRLERASVDARAEHEKAAERAMAWRQHSDEARRIHGEVQHLEAERAQLDHKAEVARTLLAQRAELEAARAELAAVRSEIQEIEAETIRQQEARATRERERSTAIADRSDVSERLMRARSARISRLAAVDAELAAARRQRDELEASGCLRQCTHVAGCTVSETAEQNRGRIRELEEQREMWQDPPGTETALEAELAQLTIPEPMPVVERTVDLEARRRKARDLELALQVAEKLAAAEAVLVEHGAALAQIDGELKQKKAALGRENALLLSIAGDPRAELERAERKERAQSEELREARTAEAEEGRRAAMLAGRLEELRAAVAELIKVESDIRETAAAAAAWKELVIAWRACRVMSLETSVIPAVEETANEVLRLFPYGLQLRLVTQRERRSGEGMAETLDVEILGGLAPAYEGLSGGQRTAVDFSLHVAIAIVVFRRQTTRLRFLYLDEPEGLDAPGRAAVAAIARWVHETFGSAVLVASHHEDLIEHVGGTRIDIEGNPGSARVCVGDEAQAVPA